MTEHHTPIRPAIVYGTRPEAIKMAPIIRAMKASDDFDPFVVVTGQHRHLLDQVNEVFGIEPDYDLGIAVAGQDLTDVTSRVLHGMRPIMRELRPDIVFVQGDTTSTFAGALAAFYERVPVGHVEAGLRTHDRYSPFPEEMNRVMTSRLGDIHFAPSPASREHLLREGVDAATIEVTGNTSIDALHLMLEMQCNDEDGEVAAIARRHDGPVILVTAHRRESWNGPIDDIAHAVEDIAAARSDALIVVVLHGNPLARHPFERVLNHVTNVRLVEPLDYRELVQLLDASTLVLTDSGGLQEEAPSIGKPVLVLRATTEREEAVAAGTARLVGTDRAAIVDSALTLLRDKSAYEAMAHATNPYGTGDASARILDRTRRYFAQA